MPSRAIRWAIIIWTLLFCFLLLPFVSLYAWNVGRRPVVTAQVTNAHQVWMKTKGGGHYSVYATLDFDRPAADRILHCRLENYYMGLPDTADAAATTLQIAVHPYSCEEPARLPLRTPSGFGDWILIYLAGCAGFGLLAFFMAYDLQRSNRIKEKRRGTIGNSSP